MNDVKPSPEDIPGQFHQEVTPIAFQKGVSPPIHDLNISGLILDRAFISQKPQRMVEDHLRLDRLVVNVFRSDRQPPGEKSMSFLHHEIPMDTIRGLVLVDDETRNAD